MKMKSYTLHIEHSSVAEKVIWLLNHFQNEGVTIKENDSAVRDIKNSIKQAVNEINMVKSGKLEARPVDDLLNAL
mgnify:CR=1 FL=1